MPRTSIIVGNGLGMALDPAHFNLSNALDEVWNDPDCLTADEKALITECLAAQDAGDHPQGEEDLDVLHRVVGACEYLSRVGEDDIHWLSDHGREFPEAIRKYITSVAWHFHYYDASLPDAFLTPLAAYLHETRSHIATLNYDNLLYQELIERQILSGYDGSLVDGFQNQAGFRAGNLERLYGRDFGYYLHLHGSPLFIDRDDRIRKQLQGSSFEIATPHLVLTHVQHKPSVIDSSYLLRTYWDYFSDAIAETCRVTVFGYSGLDAHLNSFLNARSVGKQFRVVEWDGAGDYDQRLEFWKDALSENTELVQLGDILEFTDW